MVVGIVLYLGEQTLPFGDRLRAVRVGALWEVGEVRRRRSYRIATMSATSRGWARWSSAPASGSRSMSGGRS